MHACVFICGRGFVFIRIRESRGAHFFVGVLPRDVNAEDAAAVVGGCGRA